MRLNICNITAPFMVIAQPPSLMTQVNPKYVPLALLADGCAPGATHGPQWAGNRAGMARPSSGCPRRVLSGVP